MNCEIKDIHYYYPKTKINIETFSKNKKNWNFEEIIKKTGIKYTRLSGKNESVLDMASHVSKQSINKNKIKRLDFLILVTQSPDLSIPSTSNVLHSVLKLNKDCIVFDINQGCSGFIYALAVGVSFFQTFNFRQGMIVCSEKYSKYIVDNNRTCKTVFSDGSSAILLNGSKKKHINHFELGTDGKGWNNLIVPTKSFLNSNMYKKSDKKKREFKINEIKMNGSSLYMFTMSEVIMCVKKILKKANLNKDSIDLFIFHQASKLVIDSLKKKMDIIEKKIFRNYKNYGNTVSSTIPSALKMALDKKIIKKGHKVMLVGFGVGYSWGGCILEV
jgi:3-oxoacyl-[acyl-carrier-protein] synthase-3